MIEIKRILCPTDFSPLSSTALDYAVTLAGWYGADVTALHVFEVPITPAYPTAFVPPLPSDEELAEQATLFIGKSRDPRVHIDVSVRMGSPAREIRAQSVQLGADLIVMGTHGVGGVAHLLLGSVTERVLRTASCPVLIVPPGATHLAVPPDIKMILCPVDFAPASARAVDYAFSLAQEADAGITVFHVLEPLWENTVGPVSVPEYKRLREEQALEQLHAVIPADAAHWCTPVEMLGVGKPYREILRVAELRRADLIVMGVSGQGAVGRMFFGSTTNHVVRQATCPVLTLPQPAAPRREETEKSSPSAVIITI